MKHTMKVTIALVLLFLSAQVFGLYTINKYIEVSYDELSNVIILHANTTMGEVPEFGETVKTYSFIPIMVMIIIMAFIFLFMIKMNFGRFWKYGFFLAVAIALSIVFGIYMNKYLAFVLAFILALWKVFKPNFYVHNLTEVMMYAGIAIMIVPILNIISVIGLLILVSIYDAYAVWKSKHMVAMAKFQSQSKAFAGFVIPYAKPEEVKAEKVSAKPAKAKKPLKAAVKETAYENIEAKGHGPKSAILGGGDIGFALIFCAVVMEFLILSAGLTKSAALLYSMIPALGATLSLIILFIASKKGKFYPAMPPISAGCLVGFGIVMLLV